MSPSEIAFLAVGLVIGSAVGAAVMEALRARPAPRRQVRLTIARNSVHARRSSTLADPASAGSQRPIPGSPDEGAAHGPGPEVGADEPARPGMPRPDAGPPASPARTRVPSGPVHVPASAVGVPVERGVAPASRPTEPGPRALAPHAPVGTAAPVAPRPGVGAGAAAPLTAALPGTTAVLDPIAPLTPAERTKLTVEIGAISLAPDESAAPPATLASSAEVGATPSGLVVRPRPPAPAPRLTLRDLVPVASGLDPGVGPVDGAQVPDTASAPATADVDPCAAPRRTVDERCALAEAARDQARATADALRDARRAYDILRERLDQAQAAADPRRIAAAKDDLHRQFRTASEQASGADEAEVAARDWLNAINDLNTSTREALRALEAGGAELRAAMPALERLAVEADAARISAETAEEGCRDARERLAACEESASRERAAHAASGPGPEPHPFDALWPAETDATRSDPGSSPLTAPPSGTPLILRLLDGDREALNRVVATLAAPDGSDAPTWQLRITGLMDAVTARAIEDGHLDLPEDHRFWGLFEHRERREIVAALSALGYRYDGLGGFADGRVPAARDLSLAVGYAGLDRMRIRTWPQEDELAALFAGATVAAGEWLADQADDLTLGRMVDALGSRAAELADLWNAWGRLRPVLLSSD